MAFDYSKLRGKIVEVFSTQMAFAKAMGLSGRSVSLKLNNRRSWTQNDICKAVKLLHISEDEIPLYFFALKVKSF